MSEEKVLAEYLGYVGDVEGVDYAEHYVYRETTIEVMPTAMRLVTYYEARGRDEAIKALAILKSHDWRDNVLPFGFQRRLVMWDELDDVRLEPVGKNEPYGRLRFTYLQRNVLERIAHRPVELYFRDEDQVRFETLYATAREMIAARRPEPDAVDAAATGESGSGAVDLAALEKLAALHERGVLNDEEFAAAKARLLG